MLLIRPFLRMNRSHIKPYHVVFFIFIVANVGGSLTPIGDPPFFLGILKGVPFWWVAQHMAAPWMFAVGMLLAIFLVIDTLDHRREVRSHDHDTGSQVHILGIHNFLFIGIIILGVFRREHFEAVGDLIDNGWSLGGLLESITSREILMAAAAWLRGDLPAPPSIRPMIFPSARSRKWRSCLSAFCSTVVPALHWLELMPRKWRSHARTVLLSERGIFIRAGQLADLCNLPQSPPVRHRSAAWKRESASLETKKADKYISLDRKELRSDRRWSGRSDGPISRIRYPRGRKSGEEVDVAFLIGQPGLKCIHPRDIRRFGILGGMTYIGNGPNFMVKAIAEAAACERLVSRIRLQIHADHFVAGYIGGVGGVFPMRRWARAMGARRCPPLDFRPALDDTSPLHLPGRFPRFQRSFCEKRCHMAAYAPDPKMKFTFGLWTVGNIGRDPFGEPTREPISPARFCELLGESGRMASTSTTTT